MHLKANTPYALLMVGCHFTEGPIRFPNDDSELPGILVKLDEGLSVNELLIAGAQKILGDTIDGKSLDIHQEFSSPLELKDGEAATLYLATIEAKYDMGSKEWKTMPELIREMPKDRGRLAYLRAWQVLGGGLNEDVKAFDVEDLAKSLRPQ